MRRLLLPLLLSACAPAKYYGPAPVDSDPGDVRGEDTWPDDTRRDTSEGAAATLIGATVDFAVHCCQAPPSARNRQTDVLSAEVGDGVEFDADALTAAGAVAADVDVSARRIEVTYTARATTATGTFNGYTLLLDGPGFSRITGATVAGATTAPATVTAAVSGNAVAVDIAGITTRKGMKIVVDLQLE